MFLLLIWFLVCCPHAVPYCAVMTCGFTIFELGNPYWQMITGKPPKDQAKKPLGFFSLLTLILPTHPPTPTSNSSSDARFSRICLLNTYFEYSVVLMMVAPMGQPRSSLKYFKDHCDKWRQGWGDSQLGGWVFY